MGHGTTCILFSDENRTGHIINFNNPDNIGVKPVESELAFFQEDVNQLCALCQMREQELENHQLVRTLLSRQVRVKTVARCHSSNELVTVNGSCPLNNKFVRGTVFSRRSFLDRRIDDVNFLLGVTDIRKRVSMSLKKPLSQGTNQDSIIWH